MKGKKVLIIDGDYKDKKGIVIDVYHGWGLDNISNEIYAYHDEIKQINE